MLSHIPVWVFAVLAGLVFLGIRQSRSRVLPVVVVPGIAVAMLALSAWGVLSAFGTQPAPWAGWLAGVLLACTRLARWLVPAGIRAQDGGRRVHIPGSWLPMALMMAIFGVKFMLGFLAGTGHPVAPASAAALAIAALLGLFSGAFAARGLAVWRAGRLMRSGQLEPRASATA